MPGAGSDHHALVDRLRERGFVQDEALEHQLRAVPRDPFLDGSVRALATVDAPAPIEAPLHEATPCPSPRFAATLLEAAAIEPGERLLLHGRGLAWMATLAGYLAGETGEVRLAGTDDRLRRITREKITSLAPACVSLVEAPERADGRFDRVIATDPDAPTGTLRTMLADEGLLVQVTTTEDGLDLLRVSRRGSEHAELKLGGTHIAAQAPGLARDGAPDGLTVRQLLQTEHLLAAAWRPQRTPDAVPARTLEIEKAIEETIGQALEAREITRSDPERARAAEGAFHLGYVHQMTGEFPEAMRSYAASAEIVPTAEAYTFHGWARSFDGELEGAIEDCKQAIEVDPSLGNPYNDIGAYLIELGRPDDAIGWLNRATEAERYASPQFPYLNLGRAHLMRGDRDAARDALEAALDVDPDLEAAKRLLRRLEGDL